ncbi:MAG: hypothetical protein JST10_12545, partial [Bacteroidetes bacterium]|nr:hypothetical protein [Bacteroidota bacterium]
MIKTFSLVVFSFIAFAFTETAGKKSVINESNIPQHELKKSDTSRKENKVVLKGAAIEKNAKLINLRYDKANGSIKLDSTELIEDDAPASGQPEGYDACCGKVAWIEDLKKGIVIKKIFQIEDPSATAGRVVFSGLEVPGNTASLFLSLNGEKFIRPASKLAYPGAFQYYDTAMWWDHWFFVDLPVKKLKKGNNELLLWTESKTTSWRILIADAKEYKRGSLDRTSPNRSMKSSNAGKTWSDSKLGALNAIDGEYSVRLSLDRYLSSGEYLSPLIDIVNGDNPYKKNCSNIKVSLTTEVQKPSQTDVKKFIRFGTSPFIGDATWTGWQEMENEKEYSLANKNYLQWRAELSTNDRFATPQIKSISIASSWQDNSPNQNKGLSIQVINNGEVLSPSYEYSYENLNHPELKRFREQHKLDKIIAGATTEFEVFLKLLNWAYRAPITNNGYSWNWNDAIVEPTITGQKSNQGDVLPKLNGPFYDQRRRDGMCLFSTQGLIGALLSMGYQARHVNINSEAVNGHEITEVWSNDFNKWIYLDPTLDTYYYDLTTGVPLNVLEMHRMLVEKVPNIETWDRPFAVNYGKKILSELKIGLRQGNNPFSIATSPGENGGIWAMETIGRFRIIPRNDFLSNPLPVPVHTGATSWGWNGFLNWYDDKFIKRDEFQNYSDRETDFYQPLNQAKIFLNETKERGVLDVSIKEFTPGGFDELLVATDSGEWVSQKISRWTWALKSGKNTL